MKLVQPLHSHENTLAPLIRVPYTNVLTSLDIHNHDLIIGMEILLMRLVTSFQNGNLPCVTLENVFLAHQNVRD